MRRLKRRIQSNRERRKIRKSRIWWNRLVSQFGGEIAVKFRAGKHRADSERPRQLIIKIADDETRANVFCNAPHLSQGQNTKRVFISPDLTWQQREDDKKVEAEL